MMYCKCKVIEDFQMCTLNFSSLLFLFLLFSYNQAPPGLVQVCFLELQLITSNYPSNSENPQCNIRQIISN